MTDENAAPEPQESEAQPEPETVVVKQDILRTDDVIGGLAGRGRRSLDAARRSGLRARHRCSEHDETERSK